LPKNSHFQNPETRLSAISFFFKFFTLNNLFDQTKIKSQRTFQKEKRMPLQSFTRGDCWFRVSSFVFANLLTVSGFEFRIWVSVSNSSFRRPSNSFAVLRREAQSLRKDPRRKLFSLKKIIRFNQNVKKAPSLFFKGRTAQKPTCWF